MSGDGSRALKNLLQSRREDSMAEFTHFNQNGDAVMVDVSEKEDTKRVAEASGIIRMSP